VRLRLFGAYDKPYPGIVTVSSPLDQYGILRLSPGFRFNGPIRRRFGLEFLYGDDTVTILCLEAPSVTI
jgi:hypothetical protein